MRKAAGAAKKAAQVAAKGAAVAANPQGAAIEAAKKVGKKAIDGAAKAKE